MIFVYSKNSTKCQGIRSHAFGPGFCITFCIEINMGREIVTDHADGGDCVYVVYTAVGHGANHRAVARVPATSGNLKFVNALDMHARMDTLIAGHEDDYTWFAALEYFGLFPQVDGHEVTDCLIPAELEDTGTHDPARIKWWHDQILELVPDIDTNTLAPWTLIPEEDEDHLDNVPFRDVFFIPTSHIG